MFDNSCLLALTLARGTKMAEPPREPSRMYRLDGKMGHEIRELW